MKVWRSFCLIVWLALVAATSNRVKAVVDEPTCQQQMYLIKLDFFPGEGFNWRGFIRGLFKELMGRNAPAVETIEQLFPQFNDPQNQFQADMAQHALLMIDDSDPAMMRALTQLLQASPYIASFTPDLPVRLAADKKTAADAPVESCGASWEQNQMQWCEALALVDAHGGVQQDQLVAVIDSGLDFKHNAFQASLLWQNFQAEQWIHGWDWIIDQPIQADSDRLGHGTHVAGILGADPGMGLAATPFTKVMPLRTFDANGEACASDIAKAIVFANQHGAGIINMSFVIWQDHPLIRDAITLAAEDAVLVAAAGNFGLNKTSQPFYPAAYQQVLGVEALGCDGATPPFSNYGYELAMPGLAINSLIPDGRFASYSGTSMAAPFAAAVAALLRAREPGLTTAESRHLLTVYKGRIGDLLADLFGGHPSAPNLTATAVTASQGREDLVVPALNAQPVQDFTAEENKRFVEPVGLFFPKEGCYSPFADSDKPIFASLNGGCLNQGQVLSEGAHFLVLRFPEKMNTAIMPTIAFGASAPYRDNSVYQWVKWYSPRLFTAKFTIDASIDTGKHAMVIENARTAAGVELPAMCSQAFEVKLMSQSVHITSNEQDICMAFHHQTEADSCYATDYKSRPLHFGGPIAAHQVYRSFSPRGPWVRLNDFPIVESMWRDPAPPQNFKGWLYYRVQPLNRQFREVTNNKIYPLYYDSTRSRVPAGTTAR